MDRKRDYPANLLKIQFDLPRYVSWNFQIPDFFHSEPSYFFFDNLVQYSGCLVDTYFYRMILGSKIGHFFVEYGILFDGEKHESICEITISESGSVMFGDVKPRFYYNKINRFVEFPPTDLKWSVEQLCAYTFFCHIYCPPTKLRLIADAFPDTIGTVQNQDWWKSRLFELAATYHRLWNLKNNKF